MGTNANRIRHRDGRTSISGLGMAIVGARAGFADRPPPKTPHDLPLQACISVRLPNGASECQRPPVLRCEPPGVPWYTDEIQVMTGSLRM